MKTKITTVEFDHLSSVKYIILQSLFHGLEKYNSNHKQSYQIEIIILLS